MSSAAGYPDYQRITQWLGTPLVQGTGVAVFPGPHVDGPVQAANFAAVIVALKAIGGNATVTIKQTVPGGPASLVLTTTVVVPAGATLFEAFVLFGPAVELDITGSIAGTTVDYALYGSNTTTNAQVITAATINVQHNEVLLAAEPTLDFVDTGGTIWALTDDGPGTRVKVALPNFLQLVAAGGHSIVFGSSTVPFAAAVQSGDTVIAHGLPTTPLAVIATAQLDLLNSWYVDAFGLTATQFTARGFSTAGAVTATPRFSWIAVV